jgi:hypothetical protein
MFRWQGMVWYLNHVCQLETGTPESYRNQKEILYQLGYIVSYSNDQS